MTFIPYGRQSLGAEEEQAVLEVLRGDWLTCGPRVEAFEARLAEICKTEYAVAVNSGTAALHLALKAAGIGPGDRVLTSPMTFLASANAAEFLGAQADFADIDPETICLSLENVEAAWSDEVKAVVVVDYAGYPAASCALADFVHEKGAVLIEDACHAIGGAGPDGPIGGLPWVDMTTFSFHPVKTITTGEGGAVLTRKKEWADQCRLFRTHGMTKDKERYQGLGEGGPEAGGPWYYEMQELGWNYRITDLQCAMGFCQLERLSAFGDRRRTIVKRYNEAFQDLDGLTLPASAPAGWDVVWHLYAVQIDFARLGKTRADLMAELHEREVGTQVHYIPLHLQPYYRNKYGYKPGRCPVAEAYYEACLSLPLYPKMSDEDVDQVINAVKQVCRVP
jgi:perosamine synthetase